LAGATQLSETDVNFALSVIENSQTKQSD